MAQQFCPNCGHIMEEVFCECISIGGMDSYMEIGGRYIHGQCGKPFRPGTFERISKAINQGGEEV